MNESRRRALESLLGSAVEFDVPLSRHTSLRVGGGASALAAPADREQAAECLALCARLEIPVTPLGGGFNLLVRDGGLDGVVLRTNKLRGLELQGDLLCAEAGVSHSQITRFCGDRGLGGLEFAAGIPGSVGGWVAMNAGVPERECADALADVELANAAGTVWVATGEFGFRYRGSKRLGVEPRELVIRARFRIEETHPAALRERVAEHLRHRRATQPVDQPSCGSVFKNPRGDHAGRLIEAVGLKGARHGGAAISSLHANFIVTERDARAADVLALIELAQERVRAETGILLEPEVRILGSSA